MPPPNPQTPPARPGPAGPWGVQFVPLARLQEHLNSLPASVSVHYLIPVVIEAQHGSLPGVAVVTYLAPATAKSPRSR